MPIWRIQALLNFGIGRMLPEVSGQLEIFSSTMFCSAGLRESGWRTVLRAASAFWGILRSLRCSKPPAAVCLFCPETTAVSGAAALLPPNIATTVPAAASAARSSARCPRSARTSQRTRRSLSPGRSRIITYTAAERSNPPDRPWKKSPYPASGPESALKCQSTCPQCTSTWAARASRWPPAVKATSPTN